MSPKEETFNLGMTLWHELAHVFHIQQSKNHVPRWFTEGMAEYETIVTRDEWSREHDQDLFVALRDKRLPRIGNMNKAFTRAEEMSDIATAYYASSQILVMLGEKYGRKKLNKMLTLWGEGKRTKAVVRTALGVTTEQLDKQFEAFAKKRLSRYRNRFVPIARTGSLPSAELAAKSAPKDARKQTVLALALLRHGKTKRAQAVLKKARALDPKLADARWLAAKIAMGTRNPAAAATLLDQMIADGQDGYDVQMMRAAIFEAKRDETRMVAAFDAAHKLDPTMAEPIAALVDLAKKKKDKKRELWGLRKLAKLEQHDPRVYRRLMALLLKKKKPLEAVAVGEAGLWTDLEGLRTHRQFAQALIAAKMLPRAIFELQTALLCAGRDKDYAEVHALLAEAYLGVPNRPAAKKHAAKARKMDPKNKRAKKLKI